MRAGQPAPPGAAPSAVHLLPQDPGTPQRGRPPRSSSPSERADALRVRIFLAAAEAFATKGYFGSSVEDIVGRAGMSRRTFYQVFANREDVLAALYEEVSARLLEQIENAVGAAGDAAGKAVAGIRTWMEALATHPGLARVLILDAPAAGPRLAERSERAHAAFAELIARLTAAAATQGEIVPPDPLMPRAVVGAINEAVTHLLRTGQDLWEATPLVVDLFVRLLGPRLEPAGPLAAPAPPPAANRS